MSVPRLGNRDEQITKGRQNKTGKGNQSTDCKTGRAGGREGGLTHRNIQGENTSVRDRDEMMGSSEIVPDNGQKKQIRKGKPADERRRNRAKEKIDTQEAKQNGVDKALRTLVSLTGSSVDSATNSAGAVTERQHAFRPRHAPPLPPLAPDTHGLPPKDKQTHQT